MMEKKRICPEKNLSPDYNLFILDMAKKKTDKFSTWKKKKPLERKVADELVKKSELNDKLREKQIGTSFLDLF